MRRTNKFWMVCQALDSELRIEILFHLLAVETSEFPCVNELAERFGITSPAMSVHLKKLSLAGLVASKRADRRIYYRAFATTDDGARVIESLRTFSASHPDAVRMQRFREYAHALSHVRRNMIVRCLHAKPGLSVTELARHTEMPLQTADRLWSELDKAGIIDLNGRVFVPADEPESTLLKLTLDY